MSLFGALRVRGKFSWEIVRYITYLSAEAMGAVEVAEVMGQWQGNFR